MSITPRRLGLAVALGLVSLAAAGGVASAGTPGDDGEPVIPVEFVPTGPTLPTLTDLPDIPEEPDVPDLDLPDLDLQDVPDLDEPELPQPCAPWDPAQTATVHSDPDAGTVSVMISYLGNIAATCNTLFVVHSIRLDASMNPNGLLAEEHVTMDDLAANGGSVTVTVPIDPCFARVFTDGPDAYELADTTYGEGCPDAPDPSDPDDPADPADPTDVPDPADDGGPTADEPAPQLPATGSPSGTVALLAAMFMATGLGIACAARGSQVRHPRR